MVGNYFGSSALPKLNYFGWKVLGLFLPCWASAPVKLPNLVWLRSACFCQPGNYNKSLSSSRLVVALGEGRRSGFLDHERDSEHPESGLAFGVDQSVRICAHGRQHQSNQHNLVSILTERRRCRWFNLIGSEKFWEPKCQL